jgi:hypothetical protein
MRRWDAADAAWDGWPFQPLTAFAVTGRLAAFSGNPVPAIYQHRTAADVRLCRARSFPFPPGPRKSRCAFMLFQFWRQFGLT